MSCNHFPHGPSWIKTLIETLGITITDITAEANFKYNFQTKNIKFKSNFKYMETKKTVSKKQNYFT